MILLTGAGGFLASHILEQGLDHGFAADKAIRCQYRSLRPRSYLAQKGAAFVEGGYSLDCASAEIPSQMVAGVRTVINTMGNTTARTNELAHSDNFTATKRLYEAAAEAGVQHWIQVSSIATLCSGNRELVSEKHIGEARNTAYAQEKCATDEWLRSQTGIPRLTIVYPTYMLGAWDSKPSSGGILIAMRMKRLCHFNEGMKNFVSAKEVAQGIWTIANKGITGSFILGGENETIGAFVTLATQIMSLPAADFMILARNERAPNLSETEEKQMLEFCSSSAVDTTHAKENLGFQAKTSLAAMLEETRAYFKQQKMIL